MTNIRSFCVLLVVTLLAVSCIFVKETDTAKTEGTPEICDGIDNDGDGTIDVGASDETEWFFDGDGDSYGTELVDAGGVFACTQPAGYVANIGDCDDNNAAVNPGVTEDCDDEIDNDCNPENDGNRPWHRDYDEDGYGDPSIEVESCAQPDGYVLDSTDCDDTSADINPGAEEITYDGVGPDYVPTDENCDGIAL